MSSYGTPGDDGYGGMSDSFSDKAVRLGFIRKVYAILCTQLAVTAGIVAIFRIKSISDYSQENQWLFWVAFASSFSCLIVLSCCSEIRRKTPHNFIFLGLFTVAEGFLLGMVCATYDTDEVLMAVGMCAAVTLALTIFAFQTKIDFTAMGGVLLCILVIFCIFGFICIFLPKDRILYLVYASLGAVIFSMFIVFDTQMMVGGKHQYALSPEEYVFGALNLYLDIVNLFLYILQIIVLAKN